jgi:hypothetical protein
VNNPLGMKIVGPKQPNLVENDYAWVACHYLKKYRGSKLCMVPVISIQADLWSKQNIKSFDKWYKKAREWALSAPKKSIKD